MITAIPSFKEKISNVNLNKNSAHNISDLQRAGFNKFDFSQPAPQISFKGFNLSKAGKNILGDIGSNMVKKVIRFAEETADLVKMFFRKLKGQDELPFTNKALIVADSEDVVEEALRLGINVPSEVIAHPTVSNTVYIDSEITRVKKRLADEAKKLADKKLVEAKRKDPSFRGQEDVQKANDVEDINKADDNINGGIDNIEQTDLGANDGINDIDNPGSAHFEDLDVDKNIYDFDETTLDDLDTGRLDVDLDSHDLEPDLDSHEFDLDFDGHDFDSDSHLMDADIDGPDLDDIGLDIDPDIDLSDIDPSDLI